MANPHSSVCYVEPNLVFDREITNTSEFNYGKIINPEDYCIFFSLTVEKAKREHELKSDFLTLTFTSEKGSGSTNINFMGGSMVEGRYNGEKENTARPYLTTRYADMYVTDLEDYGTPEMLGIKSVNIEYESAVIPIITIQFTDVRGMSLFTPTELSRTTTTVTKKNIEESFFQCFFNFPYPKFYVTVKGFYGRPVTYEVTCDKFNTDFNAETGNFDVTVRFIGYKYSFLTDVSLEALMAAPHTDYLGKKYWQEQVNGGHFVITDIYGKSVGMPTLYDLNNTIKDIIASKDPTINNTTLSHEEDKHVEEIRELENIKTKYDRWYEVLEQDLFKKYGKDYCYPFKANASDSGSVYTRIVVLLNKNKSGDTLASDAVQFSEELKNITNELNSSISKYNEKYKSFNKLNNISTDFSQYHRNKLFYPAYLDKYTREIKFGGFHVDNKIPPTEVKKNMFTDKDGSSNQYDKIVRIIYNDGVDQYTDCFNIEIDYSNIKKRIDYLNADANANYPQKETKKRRHERNVALIDKLGWNPTVENFTKIVMAHLETLMYMIHTTCDEIKSSPEKRTPEALNVTVGEDANCPDVASKTFVPPFPRVTRTVVNDDGSSKQEDSWVGTFNSDGWREMDLVETFFNAIEEIKKQRDAADKVREEKKNEEDKSYLCKVRYPITSFDFFLDSNVYGDDILTSFEKFVGGVAIRMFDILSLSNFANNDWKTYASKLGEIEANNFFKSVDILANKDLPKWIAADSGQFTAEKVLEIIKSAKSGDTFPWSVDKGSKKIKPLIGADKKDNWLSRYCLKESTYSYMYPVQNIKFDTIEENYNMFKSGENSENTNAVISAPLVERYKVSDSISINSHYNLIIEDDYFKVGKILEESTANGCTPYTSDTLANNTTSISKLLIADSSLDNAIGGDGNNIGYYKSFFKTGGHSSFAKKLGLKAPSKKPIEYSFFENNDYFEVCVKNGQIAGANKPDTKLKYSLYEKDENDKVPLDAYFDSEIRAKNINGIFLSEVFGYQVGSDGVRTIDNDSSLLNRSDYTATDFLMGIQCIDYTNVSKILESSKNTFTYIPKLVALQLGAILRKSLISGNEKKEYVMYKAKVTKDSIKTKMALQDGMDNLINVYLNKLSVYSRMTLIKYYENWEAEFDKTYRTKLSKEIAVKSKRSNNTPYRNLFDENSEVIRSLTNELLLPVMLVYGNVNSFGRIGSDGVEPLPRSSFVVSDDVYKNFLNGFKKQLNVLFGLDYETDESGNVVRRAKLSNNTSDEMRIEFYRYLKQLYDRWIPSSTMADWNYLNFFEGQPCNSTDSDKCYKFYFIDSYYNRVGDKLIINPQRLSERLDAFYEALDVNASVYSLLGWVYGDNRCMLKCVQNFMDLGSDSGMSQMFSAMTYSTAMANIKKGQDFVVVYTYEPSKYLNNSSSEFKDDSFMLNEEFYSPIAVRSRGADNVGKTYYRIPAFGVSYGKQYQSFFKNVSFNMGQNVQTEQAIRAKHAILLGRTKKDSNAAVGQDLFDIYTTQSYTCTVEMMGCAWVQPMMYFVVLNVPLFRGSYMIMKVSHNITPGNMTTKFTGCRMSNVSNKMIEDVFLDPLGDETTPAANNATRDEYIADVDNDCDYKTYPVFNTSSGNLSGSEKQKSKQLMDKIAKLIYGKDDCSEDAIKIAAAGLVGNIWQETLPHFDHTSASVDSDKFIAGGLCAWNDRYGNLTHLLQKRPQGYGQKEKDGSIKRIAANLGVSGVKSKLAEIGLDYQVQFLGETMGNSLKKALTACTSAGEAAIKFEKTYERSDGKTNQTRANKANDFYKAYDETTVAKSDNKNEGNDNSKMNEDIYELFFNALSKTVASTREMAFTLSHSYYPKKGAANAVMMLTAASDADKPKLSKVFDCILNSGEYFKYVNELYWVYGTSNPQGTPEHIDVKLSPKEVEPNNQRVWVVETNNIEATKKTYLNDTFNEELLKSLSKKYAKLTPNVFCTLVQQFKEEFRQNKNEKLPTMEKYSPTCCNNVGSGSNGTVAPMNIANDAECKHVVNGKIGDWDVQATVNWFNKYSRNAWNDYNCKPGAPYSPTATDGTRTDKCKLGRCWAYVKRALHAGGFPLDGSESAYMAANFLKSHGFKMIVSGKVNGHSGSDYPNKCVGDITVFAACKGHKHGHINMWCGKKWVSDFWQEGNWISGNANTDFTVWRYTGKGKGG